MHGRRPLARWAVVVLPLVLVVGGLTVTFALKALPGQAAAAPLRPESTVPRVTPLQASPSSSADAAVSTPSPETSVPAATESPAAPPADSGAASDDAPLASRIAPGVVRDGVATFYDTDGGGACLYDPSADTMTAAMNWTDYEESKACGAYVQVWGADGATVTVRITNECPSPCRVGQLDLSPQAYAKLAPLNTGETPITWTLLSPDISNTIAVRYKTGSSQWWCAIQVVDHRNPVAQLEVSVGGAWRDLPRTGYNHFISDDGSGCGGAIRITDIYGQQVVTEALPVKPEVLQSTGLQFDKH